jgi:hypothetical protein
MMNLRLVGKGNKQKGAAAVTIALLTIVMICFAALSIDIGYLMVTRNELQNVADAAALAATRKLGNYYENMAPAEQLSYTCSMAAWPCTDIIAVAIEAGLANRAGQVDIVINESDVRIGRWDFSVPLPFDPSNDPFTEQAEQPRAVRVIARRDAEANNAITTFLAGILGVDTVAVSAVATAALSGQGSAAEGELELPVGIDGQFFGPSGACGQEIFFSPTNLSCAGWTSWDYGNGANTMRDVISGVKPNPEISIGGEAYNYSGGDMATLFDDLLLLFKRKGHDVYGDEDTPVQSGDDGPVTGALPTDAPAEPLYDEDGVTPLYYPQEDKGAPVPLIARNRHVWQTSVVVYEPNNCDNPNQELKTVGFARVTITDVLVQPEKTIKGRIDCGYVSEEPTRGGGGEYGTVGSIPGLVQ